MNLLLDCSIFAYCDISYFSMPISFYMCIVSTFAYLLSYYCISTDLLSESDVLDLVPPNVIPVHRSDRDPSTTATRSVPFCRTLTTVVDWDDFLDKVASYTPSNVPMYEKKNFKFDGNYPFSIESDLYSALDRNVYRMLEWLAGPGERFGSYNAIPIKADPDRIFY